MALVNPNIAMSFRQPDIQAPNALAQFAQIQQIQGGQQAQELNALKMQEAQAAMQERNALRQLNPAAEDYENQLFKVNPQLGIQYRKERSASEASMAAANKSAFELKAAKRKFGEDFKRGLSANPSNENIIAFGQDAVLQGLYAPDQIKSMVSELLALPVEERVRILSQAGASAGELKPSVQQINQGGQTQVLRVPAFSGAPTTVGTFADVPLPANVMKQKLQIAAAGRAPGTSVTMVSEKAEQGARGKMLVDEYKAISEAAALANKTLPSIESNLSVLNKNLNTGFGTETVAAGASVLAALGVKDAEKFATDTQVFQANAISAVLQKQLEQKGPQTESDARRIEQIGAQLGKTKAANEFILGTAKELLRRDVEQRNFYARWYKKNETYDGAEDAWFSGEGGRSLFDRPALKKYAINSNAPTAADQIPTAATPARAAPAPAAAPIYARNPQTNQRIMSTDGGNTWTPAR
jgi:hypothetical protein